MKKIIIFIFAFLISLNYVYASHEFKYTFDTSDNVSLHANDNVANGMLNLQVVDGTTYNTNPTRIIHSFPSLLNLTGLQNWTFNMRLNGSDTDSGSTFFVQFMTTNGTDITTGTIAFEIRSVNLDLEFNALNGPLIASLGSKGRTMRNLSIYFNNTNCGGNNIIHANVYVNGTFIGNGSKSSCANDAFNYLTFGVEAVVTPSSFDNISVCKSTGVDIGCVNHGGVPDTTPSAITYYNLTSSDNGCENWNTNKSKPCITSSATPTVQFNTSEGAWCAIAGSSSSTSLDLNYTDMGSSRQCTGAGSGEGTTEHLCTLTTQDTLVYETSYLFISCKDSYNNQNRTSTSGALAINLTGIETTARNSMGLGIINALSSGYTIYTDQKIYARNSANSQSVGTFDKVVKKLNKIWAFNRIGASENHVNMFNITPVLYTLEFSNKTAVYIENQTAAFINLTK